VPLPLCCETRLPSWERNAISAAEIWDDPEESMVEPLLEVVLVWPLPDEVSDCVVEPF
jgi:hypothetical protein